MLYDVSLRIDYRYPAQSDHSRALLRLLPPNIGSEQLVRSRLLNVDPIPSERRDRQDFFGNHATSLAWHHPIDALSISVTVGVERAPPAPRLALSPDLAGLRHEIANWHDLGPASPHHFMSVSPRTLPDPDMKQFARDHIAPRMTAMEAVLAIGQALHREMRFDADATDVDTPAATAFANRHGVCQDFTHIMIACLRTVGIPAGYVSGFLRTYPPPGQPRLEGADAMHAWVRAWVGAETGWVEFDPTNDQSVGEDYITIGYGRDYDDVAPVRGSMRSAGAQDSTQSVDVIPHRGG